MACSTKDLNVGFKNILCENVTLKT